MQPKKMADTKYSIKPGLKFAILGHAKTPDLSNPDRPKNMHGTT
jgi:hypothetical protein